MFDVKQICVQCGGSDLGIHMYYQTTANGRRTLYACQSCETMFSETKNSPIAGLRTPISTVAAALRMRLGGMGFNETCRAQCCSGESLRRWEIRFAGLANPLLIYTLSHQFLQMIIEGDELYTKVDKNVDPDKSKGWTIVLMDRASRFIWLQECGYKNRKLFKKAMRKLAKIIEKTDDLTLVTDGERRYGNLLFEICHELIKTGKPGRPKKTLLRGVKVRLKNKGSQGRKRGPKRPKYQSPIAEHPDNATSIQNKDIHANHLEGQNATSRRTNSAFRRKQNTYAKNREGLQRTLDTHWVYHNFSKIHFTTKAIPSVAIGVINVGLSIMDLLSLQII